jgi:hypothetical protein
MAMTALPQDPAFFPGFPSGTVIPTRSLGIDAGAHVYPFGIGPARIGVGAGLLRVKGSASPPPPTGSSGSSSGSSTPSGPPTRPDVDTTVVALAPQLSLNFGTADGWSYVSAGIGQARVEIQMSPFTTGSGDSAVETPARSVSTGSLRSMNVGGGARWYAKRHLAFSFDVRFHMVAGGSRDELSTPATTIVAVTGGISLR